MKNILESQFQDEVLDSPKLSLVQFSTPICNPCKQLAPIVESTENDLIDHVQAFKVNVNESEMLAKEYNIRSVPTLILFKDGINISSKIGLITKQALTEWINSFI